MFACNQVHVTTAQYSDAGLHCAIALLSPSPPCVLPHIKALDTYGCVAIHHNQAAAATVCMYCRLCCRTGPQRMVQVNNTQVAPPLEVDYLTWSTTLYSNPLPYSQQQTAYLHKQMSVQYEVGRGCRVWCRRRGGRVRVTHGRVGRTWGRGKGKSMITWGDIWPLLDWRYINRTRWRNVA